MIIEVVGFNGLMFTK